MCLGELLLEFLHVQVVCMCVPGRAVCRSFSTLRLFCMTVRMSIGVYFSLFSFIVHPGIDGVLTYFFKKSTVWRPFDLKLPNVGQVITSHMASLLSGSFPWKRLSPLTPNVSVKSHFL